MKRLTYLILGAMALGISLSGCHRNYKVIHVRPAEDSTIQTPTPEPEEATVGDEPLLEIPPPPQEEDFTNVSNKVRQEYHDYMRGKR